MTSLNRAQDIIAAARGLRPLPRHVAAPTDAPFASEHMRWNGWVVFGAEDEYDDGHTAWYAVHEDTGETRKIDLTGRVLPAWQDFRDYIDAGFPTRSELGIGWPVGRKELDRLGAAQ